MSCTVGRSLAGDRFSRFAIPRRVRSRRVAAEVLPRLEQRELLARRPSERDKRVRLVKLTRKGRALVRRMTPAALRAHERTVEHLGAKDRKAFIEAMAILVEADGSSRTPPLKVR